MRLWLFLFLVKCFAELELVIASPHPEYLRKEFELGFIEFAQQRLGKPVRVRWFELGGTNDILRYILSFRENSGIDVVFGGGTDPFDELKAEGLLQKLNVPQEILDRLPCELNGVKLRDEDLYWVSTNLSAFGIAYRVDKVKLNLSSWRDLADEVFYKKIAISDPRKSGSARFIYELLIQTYGWREAWRLLYRMSKNSVSASFHSSELIKKLTLGEIVAAPLVESHGERAKRLVRNIGFFIPQDMPVYFGDAIAVLKGAPNQAVSELAILYALTDFQHTLVKQVGQPKGPRRKVLGRMAVDPAVYQEAGLVNDLHNPFVNLTTSEKLTGNLRRNQTASVPRFDSKLSAQRWYELSTLIGSLVIDLGYRFGQLSFHQLDSLEPPIPLEDFNNIVATKRWKNVTVRDLDISKIRRKLVAEKIPATIDFR